MTAFTLILTACLLWLPTGVSPLPGHAQQSAPNRPLPTVSLDWSELTFGTLPALPTSGGFTAPPELIRLLGYDPSRVWQAGQHADEILQLIDFADSFQLQQLSLSQIAEATGLDLVQLTLDDVALVAEQTLSDLVEALPTLGTIQLGSLEPIARLLQLQGFSFDPVETLTTLLQDEQIASLALDILPLDQFSLGSLPTLIEAPLQQFANWQQATLDSIPGLVDLPFAAFPNPLGLLNATPVQVDIAFGNAEGSITNTVSGSYQAGFAVPCLQTCAHIDLGQPVEGAQWISGLSQEVNGGYGFLGQVNSGREPTGRHPYGPGFKVVLLDVDEATGTADMGLYFRMCSKTAFVDLGCTPYFMGPVPWLSVQEEGWTVM